MLVADRTGLPLDRIEVVHGDTDVVPRGGITGGSRSAQKAGSAVAEATDALVEIARAQAADMLEANPDDVVLDLRTASFHVTGAPGAASVSWAELGGHLESKDPLRCESDFSGEGPTVPYGSYVVAVEVDIETGGCRAGEGGDRRRRRHDPQPGPRARPGARGAWPRVWPRLSVRSSATTRTATP